MATDHESDHGEDVKPNIANIKIGVVVSYEGRDLQIMVKKGTRVDKLMDAAALNMDKDTLRFTFEGKRLRGGEETLLNYDIQDGDTIDVHVQQIGGAFSGHRMS
ncbi:hypothetical protein JAAARDRAFT_478593 [Jaapia argillacea MUCL 33604]|uniref:Ubiquitin-like domain-containing protein n=1 Tax=Jaapia argillacea MUCL 33604 TaxID=933084 RepID=A0A067PQD5_9AGAM|nr:hypothetical protein JAAARDRAFT_478593 [Jaapia argillacea MUCL 33604]